MVWGIVDSLNQQKTHMRRQGEEFLLSEEELSDIKEFIRNSLARRWDHRIDHYICDDSEEDGMKRIDPVMYQMAEDIVELLWSEDDDEDVQ